MTDFSSWVAGAGFKEAFPSSSPFFIC